MQDGEEEFIEEGETQTDTVKKLRAKLAQCQREKQEYLDGWQRMKADFVNVRRDEEKRRDEHAARSVEALLYDIIAVLDSFDMALAESNGTHSTENVWRDGVANIHTQLLTSLSRHGLSAFDALGEPFDPSRHESVGTLPASEEHPENTVAEVVKRGYFFNDTVLRPATVRIAQTDNE